MNRATRDVVKLVAEAGTNRILGSTIVIDGTGDVHKLSCCAA